MNIWLMAPWMEGLFVESKTIAIHGIQVEISSWTLRRPSMSLVVKVLEGLVAAETNLDYDFLNPRIVNQRAAQPRRKTVATKLLHSILSGPR